jgi:tetratricopeptide (TPR) repeat protein
MAGACAALALWLPAGAEARCSVSAVEMPVTMVGSRAVATVGVNGTEVHLTVDSGAFFSFLTAAAAEQLKLPVRHAPEGLRVYGITGSVDTRMTKVKSLQLLKGNLPNAEFLVGGNEPGSGTMGWMGRNLLSFTDTEYDLAHGVIRFMFPTSDCDGNVMAYWAGETPVSVLELRDTGRAKVPAIEATAKLNGKDIRVLFDTGASSVISLDAANRAGVKDADMQRAGVIHGMGYGEGKAWVASIASFELGGETIRNNRLRIAEFDSDDDDMLVGVDFFLSHRIYVSTSQHRMFFTYNGGPVFALNAAAAEPAASGASAPVDAEEPTDAAGYARRGAAWAARRDFARALADLDRACEMAPQSADNFTRRGVVHLALKQVPLALKDFDTALRLDPAQSEAQVRRAWLYTESHQRDLALADLQAMDRTLAPQSNLRLDMARMYVQLQLPAQALPQWNLWVPAHRSEIGLDSVLNSRCWARVMLGIELDKALDDCDEAIDLAPKNASYADSRAWLYLRRAELRDAVSEFNRSLKLRPDAAWSLYGRGLARMRQGDADAGRADLEAARKLELTIDADVQRAGVAGDLKAPALAP